MGLSQSVQNKIISRRYTFVRGNAFVRVGACGMQGFREAQEDAEALVMRLPNHPDTALCGVFDGHDGNAASLYSAEHVPLAIDKLTNESLFENKKELCHAILDVDAAFLNTPSHREGSTAVFALMRPRGDGVQVTVANVGDSRCLWIDGKSGQCMFSTSDHKPCEYTERRRIQQAGGHVTEDRVDGQLAVSRALGDSNYKQSGDGDVGTRERQKSHKVIALADVSHLHVSAPDILLLACDGIFERLSNDSVAQFVFSEMSKPDADPALVAASLIDFSLKSGSRDNMSAIIVQLTDGTAYHHDEDEFVAGPFFQFCEDKTFRRCYEKDAARYGYSGSKLWHAAYKASMMNLEKVHNANVAAASSEEGNFDEEFERIRNQIETAYQSYLAKCP